MEGKLYFGGICDCGEDSVEGSIKVFCEYCGTYNCYMCCGFGGKDEILCSKCGSILI